MEEKTTGRAILLYLFTPEDSSSSRQRGFWPADVLCPRYRLLSGLKAVLWIAVAIAVPVALLHYA